MALRPDVQRLLDLERDGEIVIEAGQALSWKDGRPVLERNEMIVCGWCAYHGLSAGARCPACGSEL